MFCIWVCLLQHQVLVFAACNTVLGPGYRLLKEGNTVPVTLKLMFLKIHGMEATCLAPYSLCVDLLRTGQAQLLQTILSIFCRWTDPQHTIREHKTNTTYFKTGTEQKSLETMHVSLNFFLVSCYVNGYNYWDLMTSVFLKKDAIGTGRLGFGKALKH